jgi:hypothetical protein
VNGPLAISRVKLGRLYLTREVAMTLGPVDIARLVCRHCRKDYGEVPAEDVMRNNVAALTGDRVMSAYRAPDGRRIYVISEGSPESWLTTVMYAEEY